MIKHIFLVRGKRKAATQMGTTFVEYYQIDSFTMCTLTLL